MMAWLLKVRARSATSEDEVKSGICDIYKCFRLYELKIKTGTVLHTCNGRPVCLSLVVSCEYVRCVANSGAQLYAPTVALKYAKVVDAVYSPSTRSTASICASVPMDMRTPWHRSALIK